MFNALRIAPIARLTAAVVTVFLVSAVAVGAQSAGGCDQMYGIMEKLVATPVHEFLTTTSGPALALNGGKPSNSEVIWTGTAMYVLTRGKWTRLPMTAEERIQETKQKLEDPAHKAQCRRVSDTAVNGEPATLWAIHEATDFGVVDTRVWVSRRSRRVIQEDITRDVGGAAGKSHMTARLDYDHVQPPAGVR